MAHGKIATPVALALLLSLSAQGAAPPARRQPPSVPPAPRSATSADEVRQLRKALANLQQEVEQLRTGTTGSFQAARKELDGLREQVAALRKEVAELRRQPSPTQPPVERRAARFAPPPKGSIRLRNTYSLPMTILVNGKSYRLVPGETRLLRDQRPGPFTYEIPGVQEVVERTLADNETFTIELYPR